MSENTRNSEEVVILTGKDCPPCDVVEKALKGKETKMKVRFVDIESDEGKQIIKSGVKSLTLPFAIKVKQNVVAEECQIVHENGKVKIVDKSGKITSLKERE